MTGRKTLDQLISSDLDDLYDDLDRADATIERVHAVCDQLRRASALADGQPHTDHERGVIIAVLRVLAALAEPVAVASSAATEATAPCPACRRADQAGLAPAAEVLLAAFDATQLAEMLAAASTRVRRVRQLHREEYGSCAECTHEYGVSFPCATIRVLDGEEQPGA